jgi:glycosyltransferase involved in cell wall biosynthesis
MNNLTVIIPVWGSYISLLPRAVRSVASDPAISRIIVISNAADEALPKLPPHVEIIRIHKRVGLAAARNVGLEHVTSDFVAFLDADDEALLGGYAYLVAKLCAHPRQVAAAGQLIAMSSDGPERTHDWPASSAFRLARLPRAFGLYSINRSSFPTCTGAVLRTSAIRAVGGFPEVRFHEDWALAALLSWQGSVSLTRRAVAKYTIDEGSRLHHLTTSELRHTRHEVQNYILSHASMPPSVQLMRLPILWAEAARRNLPVVH